MTEFSEKAKKLSDKKFRTIKDELDNELNNNRFIKFLEKL
jgi:hypothetical protein